MNRKERRRAEAQRRAYEERMRKDGREREQKATLHQQRLTRARQEIKEPDYHPANDPEVRNGLANMIGAVDFVYADGRDASGYGHCLQRSLIAVEVLRRSNIDCQLEIGSMLYRVGPDPIRDVIAFCGPGNAGIVLNDKSALFHAWISVEDCIADFSINEWRSFDIRNEVTLPGGTPNLGPIQWTITPPKYWWKPRAELTGRWHSTGTPELGEAWYGPFNGDVRIAHEQVKLVSELFGPQITATVDRIFEEAARLIGIDDIPPRSNKPLWPIIQTESAPPGYQQTTLSEILRIAGDTLPSELQDAVAYVTAMPRTREEAITLLRNMSFSLPPGSE
jgi:hypothetical protein